MELKGHSVLNSNWMTLGSSPDHSRISDNSSHSHHFLLLHYILDDYGVNKKRFTLYMWVGMGT